MAGFLTSIDSSIYLQVAFFVIFLLIYYYYEKRLPTFRLLSLTLVRLVILALVFSYFFLTWSSAVNPSLRTASVFGMSIVNLYLLWQIILTRAELPFRLAMQGAFREADQTEALPKIIHTGKRYYYLRHFWQALFSGSFSRHFLHGLAADRLRQDLKSILHQKGIDKDLITWETLTTFLKNKIMADATLPPEFKDLMTGTMADFFGHPWIGEQINQFLAQIMDSPEDFFTGEWQNLLKSVSHES